MFPPSIQKAVLESPFNLKKMLGLLPRLPLLFTDAAMIPPLTRGLLRKHLIAIENDLNRVDVETYPRMGQRELGRELERVLVLQGILQERNQWGYGNATVFTWLLRHVAATILGLDEKWALERITKIPSNVTVASLRRILLAASETPEFAALKEIPDGVFFIALNELRSLFAGQTTADTLRPEVGSRQKAFEKEKEIPPAYYLRIDKPSEHVILTDDTPQAILSGIPASSGIVEGVARVILGAHEFHLLKTGEILVAFNTDPGWTPLLCVG